MKKLLIIAGVFATLSGASCKKDKTDPGPDNGATKLLKKVTKTEEGKTTTYNLNYDANKRLVSVISSDQNESTTFSYDNAGNLTKLESIESHVKNQYTFTYNNNVPVSGTFKNWQLTAGEPDAIMEDDELTYTVTNDAVSKIHLKMKIEPAEMDFNLSYANGNLTKIESDGQEAYKVTFTYGNKKPAFPRISTYILDQAGFSLQFALKNELLTSTYDFPGTELDNTITNNYTYDASGYVLTSNDGSTELKMEYQ